MKQITVTKTKTETKTISQVFLVPDDFDCDKDTLDKDQQELLDKKFEDQRMVTSEESTTYEESVRHS